MDFQKNLIILVVGLFIGVQYCAYQALGYFAKHLLSPQVYLPVQTFIQKAFLGFSVLGAFILFVFIRALTRNTKTDLIQLTEFAKELVSGDYHHPVLLKNNNEIGALSNLLESLRLQIIKREDSIHYQLEYDHPTGLPNRLNFTKALDKELSENPKNPVAIFVLELDRLETLYYTLGHSVSDVVIDSFSKRLSRTFFQHKLSRFSENSFICYLKNFKNKNEVIDFAKNILSFFDTPIHLGSLHVDLSGYLGIAFYPENGKEATILNQHADTAMFHARKDPLLYAFYTPEKDPYHQNQLSLMSELRYGLTQNQFKLYFQAKISLKTSKITGVEALIRWTHPKHGLIAPDNFIPQAELSGQIHHLTIWSIRKVFEQLKFWQTQGLNLNIGINLSAKDLLHKHLADATEECLNFYKINPSFLTFEITESAFMNDSDRCLKFINRLHKLGFKFAIDDFGMGYSSFSYLKKLPLDELKIDKSFTANIINDPQEASIVQSIIELAHRLKMKTTAEGMENAEIIRCLTDMGCDQGQGYFYSKALPIEELQLWLKQSNYAV